MTPSAPDLSRLIDVRRTDPRAPDHPAARRAAARGELQRLRRAIYRERLPELGELASEQRPAESRRRFLEEAAAVGLTHRGPVVFAGETALAIHGLPRLGDEPRRIELLEPRSSTRRPGADTLVHRDAFRDEDVEPWGEFFVTSPARTLADAAKWLPRSKAVTALDFALNAERAHPDQRVVKEWVRDALEASVAVRNQARAHAVIDFADAASGSPGESVSRVLFDDFGFPAPLLQVRHAAPRGRGRWFYTDFEWPEFGLIGEFDGLAKFRKSEFLAGRDAREAVIDEKLREDYLRGRGRDVARWTWSYLVRPVSLRGLLIARGLPATRASRYFGRPW
ncbi:hypothetical protein ACFOYW_07605 [Gryllotalpicola reticulitermitis]|uniref:Transcriptional regulator, AbiEi antitoxin, Type IV TA system n=1 Tax=Gryllotalpicola reticulitermitis TaxID=1184153 RepID=A0ABV8Q488_9MICO